MKRRPWLWRFTARLAVALACCMGLWWAGLNTWVLLGVMAGAEWLCRHVLPLDVLALTRQPSGVWRADTSLLITSGSGLNRAVMFLSEALLLKGIQGLPMAAALLIASRARARALFKAGVAAWTLALACPLATLWLYLSVMLNRSTSLVDLNIQPPAFSVSAPGVSVVAFFAANLAYYLSLLILPFVGPLLIWASLCPYAARRLLASLRGRRSSLL
jgi:hypothetical protein